MIRLENVIKTYKGADAPALDSVSLDIQRGEFVFLVGTSGSGKSTLLRLMLREERVDQGEVLVLGENLSQLSASKVAQFRRKLGVVFQDFRLLPNKTVYQNVAFALQVLGKPKAFIETAVPDVLELVGLSQKADRLPSALSGGEQQRVAIARALVTSPDIVLADEPTGALDSKTGAQVIDLLKELNQEGRTIILITHDLDIAASAPRRVFLRDGRIERDERGSK
jgi:cell division transport system ATP-binding protein